MFGPPKVPNLSSTLGLGTGVAFDQRAYGGRARREYGSVFCGRQAADVHVRWDEPRQRLVSLAPSVPSDCVIGLVGDDDKWVRL